MAGVTISLFMNATLTTSATLQTWYVPLQKPVFWWALGLTLVWDALGLDLWVMAAIGTAQGFPLRHHPWLAIVMHDQLKTVLLVLFGLAWLMVLWPRGLVRDFNLRQRWTAMVGVTLSLMIVSGLKRISTTSCPWDWQTFGGLAQPLSRWTWGVLDGGPGHCFPGGHASSTLAFLSIVGVALTSESVAAQRWGRRLLWVVLGLGALMGVVQTLRGAHPPSHTLWTAWICAVVSWSCVWASQRWFELPKVLLPRV